MEVEEIQRHGHKFSRICNGNGNRRLDYHQKDDDHLFQDKEAEDGEIRRTNKGGSGRSRAGGATVGGGTLDFAAGADGVGSLRGWPSRIVRVSRPSGGKDRHSKVLTSKGLRDRRVRLSVNTAIQFYDLQDRLGYDQPSKAVEWLIKAAATSISELPPINTSVSDTPLQLSDEKRPTEEAEHGFDSADVEIEDADPNNYPDQQQEHGALSKSVCTSSSQTSKGSGLSIFRSESRMKARERARERAGKEHQKNVDPISQNASFTELLTNGMNNGTTSPNNRGGGGGGESGGNFFHSSPMDYLTTALLGPPTTRATNTPHGFSGQIQLGNPLQQALTTVSPPLFTISGDHRQELQQFSLIQDRFVDHVSTAGGNSGSNDNDNNSNAYNLNFSISCSNSSGFAAGFNRGTLQSNSSSSPSLLPHFQRFSNSIDGGSNIASAFYIGTTAAPLQKAAAVAHMEDHHHLQQQQQRHFLPAGVNAGLQLFYGDADQKGKGRS